MQKNKLFLIVSFLIVLTTFAYSALATNLSITGEANFRMISDIRVTDIEYKNSTSATQEFEPKFTKDTITNGFILPNQNSSISYDVTITNRGTIDQAIYNLQTTLSNNNDVTILIDDEPINDILPILVSFKTSKKIKITYQTSNPSENIINITNKFTFKEVYYVEYNSKGGTEVDTQIKYKDVDLILTGAPTKDGSTFLGWTDDEEET